MTAPVIPAAASIRSRASGVAPLYVFFDATGTTGPTYPFGDLDYEWFFGETTAGTWTYGANTTWGKNKSSGPVAAHVYETPGTYTWFVVVWNGTEAAIRSGSITVDDPNATFSGTDTVCVSNGSDFTGAPSGSDNRSSVTNWNTAIGFITGTKKRLLFKKGDTFTVGTNTNLTLTGAGVIGAFGSGAKPVVQITASNITALGFSQDASGTWGDWRVMDIEIDGQSRTNGIGISGTGTASQLTFCRVTVHHIHNGINFSDDALNLATFPVIWDQICLYDCDAHNIMGGGGGLGLYMAATRLGVLGGTFYETSAAEFPMRLSYVGKGVIQNATFSAPASDKACFAMRSTTTLLTNVYTPGTTSQYIVVSGNDMSSASANNLAVGSAAPTTTAEDMHHVIIERNYLKSGGTISTCFGIAYNFSDAWIRNNVIVFTDASVPETSGIQIGRGATDLTPVPDRVRFDNNTVYSAINKPFYGVVRFSSSVGIFTNMTAKNNLGYAPLPSTHQFFTDDNANQTLTQTTNSTDTQISTSDPGFSNTAAFAGFRPASASGYPNTGGTASFPATKVDAFLGQSNNATIRRGAMVAQSIVNMRGVGS